jgi:hypothetical protein
LELLVTVGLVDGSAGDGDRGDLWRVVATGNTQAEFLDDVQTLAVGEAHGNGVGADLLAAGLPAQSARLGC